MWAFHDVLYVRVLVPTAGRCRSYVRSGGHGLDPPAPSSEGLVPDNAGRISAASPRHDGAFLSEIVASSCMKRVPLSLVRLGSG